MSASPIDDACLHWRKSSRTNANNNDCVEVASIRSGVLIRDSKHPDGTRLRFGRDGIRSLILAVKSS